MQEPHQIPPYDYIRTEHSLACLVDSLRAARCARLAIDVEGENNLHRYGIHVALIQLFDGTRGYIVDPLAVREKALLSALLENAPWKLVWFDAGNDLLSFQHALDIRPSPLFDCAIAARMLGKTGGLRALTGQGGSASAKDRFQKSNWLRRPISRAMLDYAISDVACLLDLADSLLGEIERKGLAAELEKRNLEAQNAERVWNPLANFTRIPGFTRFPPVERRFARLLWCAREHYARLHNLPPTNVASKQEIRRVIDKGLRDAEAIARFLNQDRQRNRIQSEDLKACFMEAEKTIDATADTRPD